MCTWVFIFILQMQYSTNVVWGKRVVELVGGYTYAVAGDRLPLLYIRGGSCIPGSGCPWSKGTTFTVTVIVVRGVTVHMTTYQLVKRGEILGGCQLNTLAERGEARTT